MKKTTSYNKLILKIILITLTFSLTIAFVYTHYMKKEAIEKLSKVDAKKTTELIFQSLYSAMERGWTRDDLENIISQNRAYQIEWEYANQIERESPLVSIMGQTLNLDDTAIDNMFMEASKI